MSLLKTLNYIKVEAYTEKNSIVSEKEKNVFIIDAIIHNTKVKQAYTS